MTQVMQWYRELHTEFGAQGWWPVCVGRGKTPQYFYCLEKLTARQEFEVALGAVLTQNTVWENVLNALDNLHAAGIWMPRDILRLHDEELHRLIRPAGYFRQKTKKLQILARAWPVRTRDGLLALWGIGEETADDIMLYAFREPYFVIDAYTRRFLASKGIEFKTYAEYQRFFMEQLPPDYRLFEEYHALIVAWAQVARSKATRERIRKPEL